MKYADKIMNNNFVSACDECCSIPMLKQNNNSSNSPFLYKSCLDTSRPYGYENSDLKNLYISNHQLQSRMITPVISQDTLLEQGFPRSK